MNKINIEIINILEKGTCPREHKVGDKFEYPEDVGKICQSAYNTIYPTLRTLLYDGVLPWEKENPDQTTLCCSDPSNPVVFRITRTKVD